MAAALSALAVLGVAFTATLSAGSGPRQIVASSQMAPVVIEVPVFGVTNTDVTNPPEFANATVVNNTSAGIHITGVTVSNAPKVFNYSAIGPDTCSNTVLPAGGYCVVGLEDASPNDTVDNGTVVVHTIEQKDVRATLSSSLDGYYGLRDADQPLPPPALVSFGSLDVGTSSAPKKVTVADVGTTLNSSGYLTQVVLTGENPGDFSIASDGCTGQMLGFTANPAGAVVVPIPQTCPVSVVAKPGAVGSRTAWLDVTYCPFKPSDGSTTVCTRDGTFIEYALHLLVRLTVTGVSTTTPPPVTSNPPPVTSNPPPGNPPPGPFHPSLTTSPDVVPGGRVTLVSGTGFPGGRPVTVAMLPLGAAPLTTSAALAERPGARSTKTDGSGSFRDLPLVVMAHTPPGTYPLEAIADGPSGPVAVTIAFLVVPGTEQPPQFVNRH